MDDLLKDSWTNTNDPISKQIKQRLIKAGKNFIVMTIFPNTLKTEN